MIALGELQTHLGPDARISARAETLGMDPRVDESVGANTPKSWWVGVSHSDGVTKLADNTQDIVWLVSGLSGGLAGSLNNPVKMIGDGSFDRSAFTGGSDIEAGRVELTDDSGQINGAYAWFVDDNGMKAQLKSSHLQVRNDNADLPGRILPASYDISILPGMQKVATAPEKIQRLGSLRDLELLGGGPDAARSAFFGYTTRSYGVLSDVKKGGLKKDLSVAFDWPDATVFNKVFPRNNPEQSLAIDEDRLNSASELDRPDGYINMAIFRDYFNLKEHLQTSATGEVGLVATTFHKDFFEDGNVPGVSGVYSGAFGPHGNWNLTGTHAGMPYGEYSVFQAAAAYRDNPIIPILSSLQQQVWLEPAPDPTQTRIKVQMFSSHYNPYNIALILSGRDPTHTGPRLLNFPQVEVSVPSMKGPLKFGANALKNSLQVHAPSGAGLFLPPGRSQFLAFKGIKSWLDAGDQNLYSAKVGLVSLDHSYREVSGTLNPSAPATVNFIFSSDNMIQGVDDHPGSGDDYEVSQIFYAPFSTHMVGGRPGKTLPMPNPLGPTSVVSNGIYLRTTNEGGSSNIRPLVDANIRALFNNPRWDSPLGLNLLASHSETAVPATPSPQMTVGENDFGYGYLGSDRDPNGSDRVILFDVARSDLVSLGQLQHAAAGRFSYEPTYIAGNSYANPRIPLNDWRATVTDTFSSTRSPLPSAGSFTLYDASYLVNERLWDEYIFTTIPQKNPDLNASEAESLLSRSTFLANPRFIPYEPAGSTFSPSVLSDPGTPQTGSFFHNAGHLLVDGQFNVNSTSVDAWEAFLSGTHDLPVASINQRGQLTGFNTVDGVRFPRASSHLGDGMKTSSLDQNYWIGFRELEQSEVRELAEEIVEEVRKRGPFLTLGEFVNRRLAGGGGANELSKSGALQAALDKTLNDDLGGTFAGPAGGYSQIPSGNTQGSGFPGQLLQGDVLQALSPYMTVRSDTFTIRAYGEARNLTNGDVTATAYCEAVVQRFPDPVAPDGTSRGTLEELAVPSSPFGRKFSIVSFRWLAPEEI